MNGKQKKTPAAVFTDPVSGTIAWAEIESLLISVGCTIVEGSGSRVRFVFGAEAEFLHRPQPDKGPSGVRFVPPVISWQG